MQLVTVGGAALRLTPQGTERLETAGELSVDVTGRECNAAVAASRLGADAAWVSRLPDDPLGRRVAGELRGYEVEVLVEFCDGRQGITFFERGAVPRKDGRVDYLADTAVEGLSMDALSAERVEAADIAYVTATTPTASRQLAKTSAKFLKTAADGGATTALGLLDPDRWAATDSATETLEGLFPAVDTLVATAEAVEAVFGRSGEPTRVTHALASDHDFETVALLRENDAAVWRDSTVHEFALPAVETVDMTGAVDAFGGAFLVGLADGEVQAALREAVAADALVKTMPGALPVFTRSELEAVAGTVERPRSGR